MNECPYVRVIWLIIWEYCVFKFWACLPNSTSYYRAFWFCIIAAVALFVGLTVVGQILFWSAVWNQVKTKPFKVATLPTVNVLCQVLVNIRNGIESFSGWKKPYLNIDDIWKFQGLFDLDSNWTCMCGLNLGIWEYLQDWRVSTVTCTLTIKLCFSKRNCQKFFLLHDRIFNL